MMSESNKPVSYKNLKLPTKKKVGESWGELFISKRKKEWDIVK